MSCGVVCQREGCRHYEEAHDAETGVCRSEWGPPGARVKCECPGLLLPADADRQREFAKLVQEWH